MQLKMPGGFSFEMDTAESARLWHADRRTDPTIVGVVGFSLQTRQAVAERYAELTLAGYRGGSRRSTRSGVRAMRSWQIPTAMTSGLMSPLDE
jgi:hypothetical protein